jgi:polysaccharide pyruvyl transferase WcaK-like protein
MSSVHATAPSVVLVGGWSWHRHVGDDAILRAHLSELRRALPRHRVLVVCSEPERLTERMGVRALWSAAPAIAQLLDPALAHADVTSADLVPVVAATVAAARDGRAGELPELAPLVAAVAAADAVVAASAGSLTAAYPLTVAEQVVVLRIAQALGKPTVVSGASLGPFDTPADGDLLAPALAAADLVTVRDATVSPRRAAELGVPAERIAIQPDPAFWMERAADDEADAAARRGGIDLERELGLLTVAPWPGGADQTGPLGAVVDTVTRATDVSFVGVPMYLPPAPADDAALDAVRMRMSSPERLTRADPVPDDPALLALSGRARVVLGSRFHGAVLAAAAGAPSVLVHDGPYQRGKAEGLAASVASVRAVPLAAGPDAISAAVLEQLDETPDAVEPAGPLPAVAWLAEYLRGRTAVAQRGRRWLRRLIVSSPD